MKIEDELRGALDVPAPPPTTTLDDVLRRGRRRVFAQRAGAVLGVVAMVAGIGVATATLNVTAPPSPATPPVTPPSTLTSPSPAGVLDWQRVSTPPQQPRSSFRPGSTAPPPPGRRILELPQCDVRMWSIDLPQYPGSVALSPSFLGVVQMALQRYAGDAEVGMVLTRMNRPDYEIDLTDSQGTGSVRIIAGRFTGTPLAAADAGLWETGDCQPPYRHVLPNGSIVQLHEVHAFEPFQSLVQRMTVYRADGMLIQLELCSFGSPHSRPDPKQPHVWERVGAGRETLPMPEQQFALLGLAVAEAA